MSETEEAGFVSVAPHRLALALYECVSLQSFSLALLELIGVKIPQSHSQVITDASHPRTHTGSWITIFFVRLISLLCLFFFLNQVGGIWACMDVQSLTDEIYFLQMEIKLLITESFLAWMWLIWRLSLRIDWLNISSHSLYMADPRRAASGYFLLSQLRAGEWISFEWCTISQKAEW